MTIYIFLLNCFMAVAMVLYNWKSNFNIIFLGLLIISYTCGVVTYYILAFEQSRFWIAVFYGNLAPLWYLPGPLLYFYVRGSLKDSPTMKKSDLLHLIPFVIAVAGIFPYIVSSFSNKLHVADTIIEDLNTIRTLKVNWILPHEWNMKLRPFLIILYAIGCMVMIIRTRPEAIRQNFVSREQWLFFRKWLLFLSGLLFLFTLPSLLITSHFVTDYSQSRGGWIDRFFSVSLGIPLFIFPAILVSFPQILYGIPHPRQLRNKHKGDPDTIAQPEAVSGQVPERETDPASVNLLEDPFSGLGERVLQVMAEKKPFLNPEFTLEDLADLLQVPKHHLYYCFQHNLHTKFTRLRTRFRVDHARNLLTETDLSITTIDAIGRNSGFASKTSFYTIFKAEAGLSPGEYAQKWNKLGYKASD